jgi:hypothetical protein
MTRFATDGQYAMDSNAAEQINALTGLWPDRWLKSHPEHRRAER